jgi:hypothetical protein
MGRVLYLLLSKIRLVCLIKRPKIAVVGRASKQKINIELPLRFPQLIEQGLPMHRLLYHIRWLQQLKAQRLIEAQVAARCYQTCGGVLQRTKLFPAADAAQIPTAELTIGTNLISRCRRLARGSINKKWLLLTSPPRINELGYSHG